MWPCLGAPYSNANRNKWSMSHMSQDNPSPPVLTADQLQAIRDADAAVGEDLQFCPPSWTHIRGLLGYIDKLIQDREDDALAVAALSNMLEPYSGGTSDLHDLVARMHRAREIQQAVHAAEGT